MHRQAVSAGADACAAHAAVIGAVLRDRNGQFFPLAIRERRFGRAHIVFEICHVGRHHRHTVYVRIVQRPLERRGQNRPAPGFAGLWQINLRVPSGLQGNIELRVTAAGVASNTVLLPTG